MRGNSMNNINVKDITNCYGCGVYAASCGKKIIKIQLNENGFYTPYIDEPNKCTECGISLFANASLVVTSSFHGTAFALNFGVPLVSVVPDNVGDDRQTSLLKACGAENCIAKIDSEIETIQPQYDITVVKDKLENLRQDSINWIKSNII